ncbi:hypothetical protein [Aeoliella sp.]|uniref:hypothetical protein n=1 Tax=Aeoliella sp. TaxID=2795800 RepID=UPI003CCB870C
MAKNASQTTGKSGSEVTEEQVRAEMRDLMRHEGCSRREAMYRMKKRYPEARAMFKVGRPLPE